MFYDPTEENLIDERKLKIFEKANKQFKKISSKMSFKSVRGQFRPKKNKSPIHVLVASNKGGVGKSSTALNVAWELSKIGYKVLLNDLDAQANITCSLLMDQSKTEAEKCLYDVLLNKASLDEIISTVTEGLDVMGANSTLSEIDYYLRSVEKPTKEENYFNKDITKENESNELYFQMYELFKTYTQTKGYDFVIYDTNPETNRFNRISMQISDFVIIPIQAKESSAKAFNVTFTEVRDAFITIGRNVDNLEKRVKVLFNNLTPLPESKKDSILKNVYKFYEDNIFETYIDYDYDLGVSAELGCPSFLCEEISTVPVENFSQLTNEILEWIDQVQSKPVSKKRKSLF